MPFRSDVGGAWRTALAAAAWLALSCATQEAPRVESAATDAAGSFTLSEKVRASGETREDFERAARLLEEERWAEAIPLLVAVTEAAPRATAAHIDLAIAQQRTGDLAGAEASLAKALALSPDHPVALNELGMLQRRTGRFAEARRSYERALAQHPSFHYARRNLAILCDLYLADTTCALENYELYAQAVPDDREVASWITDLRKRSGRVE